jgi:hypothetical protein
VQRDLQRRNQLHSQATHLLDIHHSRMTAAQTLTKVHPERDSEREFQAHLLLGVSGALQHGQHNAAQRQGQVPLRRLLLHRQVQEVRHHLRAGAGLCAARLDVFGSRVIMQCSVQVMLWLLLKMLEAL